MHLTPPSAADQRVSARVRKPISSRETATLDALKSEEFGLRRRAAAAPAPAAGAKRGEANEGLRRVGLGLRARNSNVKYNEKEARESEGEEEEDDDAPRRRRLPAPKKETKAAPPRRTYPRSPSFGSTRLCELSWCLCLRMHF